MGKGCPSDNSAEGRIEDCHHRQAWTEDPATDADARGGQGVVEWRQVFESLNLGSDLIIDQEALTLKWLRRRRSQCTARAGLDRLKGPVRHQSCARSRPRGRGKGGLELLQDSGLGIRNL